MGREMGGRACVCVEGGGPHWEVFSGRRVCAWAGDALPAKIGARSDLIERTGLLRMADPIEPTGNRSGQHTMEGIRGGMPTPSMTTRKGGVRDGERPKRRKLPAGYGVGAAAKSRGAGRNIQPPPRGQASETSPTGPRGATRRATDQIGGCRARIR